MSLVQWPAKCLSWAYTGAIQVRNGLYDRGVMSLKSFEKPIVSVGNISVGGTGKTPMIQSLVQWASEHNLKPGIVSRGYGGEYTEVQEVDFEANDSTRMFGDEPVLTKSRFPNVPFYVCRERARAVEEMLKKHSIDIVFADDAFQHRALGRDLDIVMLDAGQGPDHYAPLPLGRLREPLEQLSRAHFIVVTRWNLADEKRREFLTTLIDAHTSERLQATIHCDYNIENIDSLQSDDQVILFSGIGNPKAFENLVGKQVKVLSHKVFRDHHEYSKEDLRVLLEELESSGARALVTTEKDAVKLQFLGLDLSKVVVAKLSLTFDSNLEKLFGAINKLST